MKPPESPDHRHTPATAAEIMEMMRQATLPERASQGIDPPPFNFDIRRPDRPMGVSQADYLVRRELYERIQRTASGDREIERLWVAYQTRMNDRGDVALDIPALRAFEDVLRTLLVIQQRHEATILTINADYERGRQQDHDASINLADALRTLLRAYEGAERRDNVSYMDDAAWEADAVLEQHAGHGVLDMADVDAESTDGI